MNYNEMRQWRDICEYLNGAYYKFVAGDRIPARFNLLSVSSRPQRQQLWSRYMIQFVRWEIHPHAQYYRRSKWRKTFGWTLLPSWEIKLDFLEQITLFNRSPDDVPQPWRSLIWEAVIRREEREIQARVQAQQEAIQTQQRREQLRQFKKEAAVHDTCPAGIGCKEMSGAAGASQCPNLAQCRAFVGGL